MKICSLICHKLVLTQFWPKVVSWRFEITNDELNDLGPHFQICRFRILPLIALSVITGLATFGYVNIPMAMSGELFPLETKVAATRLDMVLLPGSPTLQFSNLADFSIC